MYNYLSGKPGVKFIEFTYLLKERTNHKWFTRRMPCKQSKSPKPLWLHTVTGPPSGEVEMGSRTSDNRGLWKGWWMGSMRTMMPMCYRLRKSIQTLLVFNLYPLWTSIRFKVGIPTGLCSCCLDCKL